MMVTGSPQTHTMASGPRRSGGGAQRGTQAETRATRAASCLLLSARATRRTQSARICGGCMKVFLTGGSGYIGSAVALALKKAGHDVLALVRDEAKAQALKSAGVKLVKGDLGNPAGYAGAAWGRAAFVNLAQDYSPAGVELDKKTITSAKDLLRGQVGATFIYTTRCSLHGPTHA